MGLYKLGKEAAIQSIKAAVSSRVAIQADGSYVLDATSLRQWIWKQGNDIVNSDVEKKNKTEAKKTLATVDANPAVDALAFTYSLQNWQGKAAFPTSEKLSSADGFVSAVYEQMLNAENLVAKIESHYTETKEQLPWILDSLYEGSGAALNVPPTEVRIPDVRYYIYTWVTNDGWESAPSPIAGPIECDQRDTVNITRAATPPNGYNIAGFRIYRSNVGNNGANFQALAPIARDDTKTGYIWRNGAFMYYALTVQGGIDDVKSHQLQETCPTTTWLPPPNGIKFVTTLPNGMMAACFDNTVCFCEPFTPYAWPVEYQISVDSPIVAMGSFGQTLVVFHQRGIDYISGADSASMASQKDISHQTCVSSRSVVSIEGGVVFASPDGLFLAGGQGVLNLTEAIFMREEWQALKPESLVCAFAESTVYIFGVNMPWAYGLHIPTKRLTTHKMERPYSAFYQDRMNDAVYASSGTQVFKLFNGNPKTSVWKSKRFVLPKQAGFAWLVIESDFESSITVRWYGDGKLHYSIEVTSRAPVRLPPGRWLEHEIEVETKARWSKLTLASSGDELRGV